MEANRNSAPDAIPEEIVAQHLREAQITVVSSHYLRHLGKDSLARRLYIRLLLNHSEILIPLGLTAIALAAFVGWLVIAPESTPLFIASSVVVVSATLTLIRHVWLWVCSYQAAAETTREAS